MRGSGSVASDEIQLFEAEIQLAARPGIGRRVGDLLRRQARRSPVRRLRALGDSRTEKDPREIAHARLHQAVALRNLAEVDHRSFLEPDQLLQVAQVVAHRYARLYDLRGRKD